MPTKTRKPNTKTGGFGSLPPLYLVKATESHQDVARVLLESEGQVLLLALDLPRLGWTPERAAEWTEAFRVEYQLRLFDWTRDAGGKRSEGSGPVKAFPLIAVFGASFPARDREKLVDAGATVVDRSLEANRECQTPEQLLLRLFPKQDSPVGSQGVAWWDRPVDPTPGAKPTDFNDYPAGVAPGDLRDALARKQQAEKL